MKVGPTAATTADAPPLAAPETAPRVVRTEYAIWIVLAHWIDRVLGDGAPDWFALERCGIAESLKIGQDRSIRRVTLPSGPIVAKVRRPRGLGSRWAMRFGVDAARREWRAGRRAARRGVLVVPPIAVGVRSAGEPSTVVLSEGVSDGQTLARAWARVGASIDRSGRHQDANAIVDAVAELFGCAHERGVIHLDGHPGNVLLNRSSSGDGWSARFVDLDRVRCHRAALGPRRSALSLAALDHYFRRTASPALRLRFLLRYLANRRRSVERVDPRWRPRAMARAVTTRARRHALALARHRDRRLRRTGGYFGRVRLADGWRACVALRLARRRVLAAPIGCDRSAEDWRALLTAILGCSGDDPSASSALRGEHGVRVVRDRPHGAWAALVWSVFGSPGRRRFEHAHRLRHRDLPGAVVLAWAERRRFGLVRDALTVLPDAER